MIAKVTMCFHLKFWCVMNPLLSHIPHRRKHQEIWLSKLRPCHASCAYLQWQCWKMLIIQGRCWRHFIKPRYLPAIELEKTTRRTLFLFLATLRSTVLVPLTAGSMRSLCTEGKIQTGDTIFDSFEIQCKFAGRYFRGTCGSLEGLPALKRPTLSDR